MNTNKVGIVIPFFQRQQGILVKALNSICAQNVSNTSFTIVVVDDESPISGESEIAAVDFPKHCHVKLLKQKNSGPAVARNAGLDYIQSCDIPTVAFLDSDDIWTEQHIANALLALDEGASFYFCDHNRFNQDCSWFNSVDVLKDWDRAADQYKITVSKSKQLASLSGDNCFKLFLEEYLSQTSSVVYDFKLHSTLRFDPSLVSAGEDFFLWLQLVHHSEKVTFSLEQNIYCGEGINMYFNAFDWNKLASSTKHGCQYILYKMIQSSFTLQQSEREMIKGISNLHLNTYSYLMIKHLILKIGVNRNLFKIIVKKYPFDAVSIPFRFIKGIFNKKSLYL